MGMGTGGFAGFGMGRKSILSALMWVTLAVTVLNWTVLIIFYWVSQAQETTPISWYLTPYWWMHIFATGAFTAATVDSVQQVSFILKPSLWATVFMALATLVDMVGGYFMIIDYWGKCIFSTNSLNSIQKIGCSNEKLYVWVVAIGAIIAIVTAFVAFVLALWDTVVRFVRSRQFAMVSGGFQELGARGQNLVGGLLRRPSTTESSEFGPETSSTPPENMYHSLPKSGYYGGSSQMPTSAQPPPVQNWPRHRQRPNSRN